MADFKILLQEASEHYESAYRIMIQIACQTAKLLKSHDFGAPNRWFDTLIHSKYFGHFTYLNLYLSSPLKHDDVLQGKIAGCVSSWPVEQAYSQNIPPNSITRLNNRTY